MKVDLFECVSECGCAAKVPAQDLAGLLSTMDMPRNSAVLVGPETLDDAGVYQLPGGTCLVQTVDFFPPVARNPEDYGRIAAANSLSDIYAMGAKPLTALAMVCCPAPLVQHGVLASILRGASEKLGEAEVALLGGHSVLDAQSGLDAVQRERQRPAARLRLLPEPLGIPTHRLPVLRHDRF